MATFFFSNPEFRLPSLSELERRWRNVPDAKVRATISAEHQYLHFQEFLLARLRYRTPRGEGAFGLSARAGAVKSAVLLHGSIVEAVLHAHAEARGYVRAGRKLTLGQALNIWEKSGDPELADVWTDIQFLLQRRNTVHLFNAAGDTEAYFRRVLASERSVLERCRRTLTRLQALGAPSPAAPVAAPAARLAIPAPPLASEDPEEVERWLFRFADAAEGDQYRSAMRRWIELNPYLHPDDWARMPERIEADRLVMEDELWEEWNREEYERHVREYDEFSSGGQRDEPELSWQDEAMIDAYMGADYAPEEEDEDNPNWYPGEDDEEEYDDDSDEYD